MSSFVLIHGAWHGGWCWHEVADALRARGHQVLAPDLPGHGDDTTPVTEVSLDAYAERTVAALRELPHAQLVGHSMGGMVISAAAARAPELIDQLVYLCAFAPIDGDSLNSSARMNRVSAIPAAIEVNAAGTATTVKANALQGAFYHDCPPASIELARRKLVPQSLRPFSDTLSLGARHDAIPKAYIECIEDQAIHIATQRAMYRRAGISRIATLNTSHSPFFSAPLLLAHTLESLAQPPR